MKRFLQLLGEMNSYRLPTAKRALEELAVDDELVVVVPEQALAGEIQQWATSQGLTVAAPKKMLDGMPRWQLSVKKAAPASAEEKPVATAPTPAAPPAPITAATPAAAPASAAAPTPPAAPVSTTTPVTSGAPATAAVPTPAAGPTPPTAPATTAAPASAGPTD